VLVPQIRQGITEADGPLLENHVHEGAVDEGDDWQFLNCIHCY